MSAAIRITVARTAGSVPREAGTQMCVWADKTEGTIGGGALEWQAMATARRMLEVGQITGRETIPLGPGLGQCCGGSVTLDYAEASDLRVTKGRNLWIWGAGHVGRAIAGVMAPLPEHDVTLIDINADRMPDEMPGVTQVIAADMPLWVAHAPPSADHLIVTYSHQVDLALCHTLLGHGFGSCGLIGSKTKWTRFRGRLQSMGNSAEQIARIACPIGDPTLGKHPQAIAVGVAATVINNNGLGAAGEETG